MITWFVNYSVLSHTKSLRRATGVFLMKLDFCCACGCTDKSLEHHHLTPRSAGGSDDETNLITLCIDCHGAIHGMLRKDISKLTRDGLAKARKRGVKLGSPDPARAGRISAEKRKGKVKTLYKLALPHIKPLYEKNMSLRQIASALNENSVPTSNGGKQWYASSVRNLIRDFKAADLL